MKKLTHFLARILHVVAYPFIGVILHNSRRVRVMVISGEKILLHKGLLGKQRWSLPGGGINRGEKPEDAVVRELHEEVGIQISSDTVQYLGERKLPIKPRWPQYTAQFYIVRLEEVVEPTISRPYEVIAASWFNLAELPDNLGESAVVGLDLLNSDRTR